MNMGVFPSGQRGQTVNLLALPSVVRIHPLPPRRRGLCIVRDDFSFEKSSAHLRRRSSFPQKFTLAAAVRLQARSLSLRSATNFLRDARVRSHQQKHKNIFFIALRHSGKSQKCGFFLLLCGFRRFLALNFTSENCLFFNSITHKSTFTSHKTSHEIQPPNHF